MNFLQGVLLSFTLLFAFAASTRLLACQINGSADRISKLNDPIFLLLSSLPDCPETILELKAAFEKNGIAFSPSMVANRGFSNPAAGNFSFFEVANSVTNSPLKVKHDELFLGHFTRAKGGELILDQDPRRTGLMGEFIVWDQRKELYNFYELLSSPSGSKWFYRGDSRDIWNDVALLHRKRKSGELPFGNRLRCSGCHIAGGPIMKELKPPHDSWWTEERQLPLGGRTPNTEVQVIMDKLEGPPTLAAAVIDGTLRLQSGRAFQERMKSNPQVALRPLFCPEEINLESNPEVDGDPHGNISVPSGFFIDRRLALREPDLISPIRHYEDALTQYRSAFPETGALDADHAWLTPVKATSDILAVDQLVEMDLISRHFVQAVLAVDFTRPVFSQERCGLLKSVPEKWSANFLDEFKESLTQNRGEAARKLIHHLDATEDEILSPIDAYTSACKNRLSEKSGAFQLVAYLDQLRKESSASEISQNPLGQILEPGFRVIFPVFQHASAEPWAKTLDANTCRPAASL